MTDVELHPGRVCVEYNIASNSLIIIGRMDDIFDVLDASGNMTWMSRSTIIAWYSAVPELT